MKNRIVITYAGGGGSPEPATEWHPRLNPSENLTIAIKQSVLADAVKSNVKDGAPAPVRVSETGRARKGALCRTKRFIIVL